MKARIKRFLFGLLGKDPEAIVVTFASGDPELARRMFEEVQCLVPERRHFLVMPQDFAGFRALRRRFAKFRIGLAPVLFTGEPQYQPMRRAALLLAPTKILAYNRQLERHHLRLRTGIASWLFLRGVPLDRIFLRPRWLVPWKKDRSVFPSEHREFEGRAFSTIRKRVAVLTPYFPYPLAHGGAVRMFALLRETAQQFDVILFSFSEDLDKEEVGPVQALCARVVLVKKPRYREPRWSTLKPPEVCEFDSPAMRRLIEQKRIEWNFHVLQVEYTALAPYHGDILVEHDVTFQLYRQILDRERSLSARWDYWRWLRFERAWVRRYQRVVVMSEEDRAVLARPNVTVIPNGVDLARFIPEHERPGERLLFIGSFRHFPNIVAYRFFVEQVWPLLQDEAPAARVTIVAGPDPLLYWRVHTNMLELPSDERITLEGFVRDVRPLYIEVNLVIVPTLVSAGTNLKVLEALAMERAVVSTTSGCAGLGLEHGKNVWIADGPGEFAAAIRKLLTDRGLRQQIAEAGRLHAEQRFDWRVLGGLQRALLRQLLDSRIELRPARAADLDAIWAIQATAPEASQWTRDDYLTYDCTVAVTDGRMVGFLVSRYIGQGEREILNIAVHPEFRRAGVATELIQAELKLWPGEHFLEVRQSNTPARTLYRRLGFQEVGVRPGYYENPPEPGIVMRFLS